MKVYIKNKFMSLGGSSTVVDQNKNPLFKVKGKILSITRKKKIKDKKRGDKACLFPCLHKVFPKVCQVFALFLCLLKAQEHKRRLS